MKWRVVNVARGYGFIELGLAIPAARGLAAVPVAVCEGYAGVILGGDYRDIGEEEEDDVDEREEWRESQ